jgi:hypothetical protein
MTMISGGDEKVRNAFRATLREEPSRPNLDVSGTQELDASDILEVGDLASAIARAEEIIRLPQPRDMFDVLSRATTQPERARDAKTTDDCIGPALPAPYGTPVPPPPSVPPAPVNAAPARMPVIMVPAEEDAYYHPGGNIRSFADVTLDGYRPEPTFQIKLRARRHSFGWIVGAVLGPLALLLALSVFLRSATSSASAPVVVEPPKPVAVAPPPSPPAPPSPVSPAATAEPASTVPSMDVKKLPPASGTTTPKVVRPQPAPRRH